MPTLDTSGYTLAVYVPQFQECVLRHLREALPDAEWTRFRRMAQSIPQDAPMPESLALRDIATRENLVEETISEAGLSVSEIAEHYRPTKIGEVAGQPVCYFEGSGIYAWERRPDDGFILELWATTPAYPPGW